MSVYMDELTLYSDVPLLACWDDTDDEEGDGDDAWYYTIEDAEEEDEE